MATPLTLKEDKFKNLNEYEIINISGVDESNSYRNINDIKYAIIPNNINVDKILSNNFYVVYNITDIYTNYVLKVNGEENVLNSIFKKYYTRWMKSNYSKTIIKIIC